MSCFNTGLSSLMGSNCGHWWFDVPSLQRCHVFSRYKEKNPAREDERQNKLVNTPKQKRASSQLRDLILRSFGIYILWACPIGSLEKCEFISASMQLHSKRQDMIVVRLEKLCSSFSHHCNGLRLEVCKLTNNPGGKHPNRNWAWPANDRKPRWGKSFPHCDQGLRGMFPASYVFLLFVDV